MHGGSLGERAWEHGFWAYLFLRQTVLCMEWKNTNCEVVYRMASKAMGTKEVAYGGCIVWDKATTTLRGWAAQGELAKGTEELAELVENQDGIMSRLPTKVFKVEAVNWNGRWGLERSTGSSNMNGTSDLSKTTFFFNRDLAQIFTDWFSTSMNVQQDIW